jgi:hypothetical protein
MTATSATIRHFGLPDCALSPVWVVELFDGVDPVEGIAAIAVIFIQRNNDSDSAGGAASSTTATTTSSTSGIPE